MKFEINFNTETRDGVLAQLGNYIEQEEFSYYEVELNTFEELENLVIKLNQLMFKRDFGYSALISFDPPTIYFDKNA
jgi:hypothetical protein